MAAAQASPFSTFICTCSADACFAGPLASQRLEVLFFQVLQLKLGSVLRRIVCPCRAAFRASLSFLPPCSSPDSSHLLPRPSNRPAPGKLLRLSAFIRSRA